MLLTGIVCNFRHQFSVGIVVAPTASPRSSEVEVGLGSPPMVVRMPVVVDLARMTWCVGEDVVSVEDTLGTYIMGVCDQRL